MAYPKRCSLGLRARTLLVGRRSFALHSKKSSGICRRVYVDHDVVLSPRQQVDVPVRSTLKSVRVSESENWLLESRQLRPGIHLARTLLPDKHRDISVRVVNTTSEHQVLRHICVLEIWNMLKFVKMLAQQP